MVELKHVSFAYEEGSDILSDVNFTLNRGEFCFVIGDSGSGKSTFSKLLTGELHARTGDVLVNGYNMQKIKRRALAKARRTIGVVYQEFRIVPTWTVWENLEFAMVCVGANSKNITRRIHEVLDLVSLEEKSDRYPRELSGGEQQRVAIARAIINHPDLLVADEPTGNLDPALAQEIMSLFYKICDEEKIPTIVITHALDLVKRSGRRVVRIKSGKLVGGGK